MKIFIAKNISTLLFLIITIIIVASLISREINSPNLIHKEKSIYRDIYVTEHKGTRCMTFIKNYNSQSCVLLSDPNKHVLLYTKLLLSALYVANDPKSILVVGLGGGTIPRTLRNIYPTSKIDVVELDPAIKKVANDFFYFKEDANLKVFFDDARIFIRKIKNSSDKYDLVIMDAFSEKYIPEHLLTKEFLLEAKAILSPKGVLAANTFSSSKIYDNESATYHSVYGDFYSVKVENINRIIIASNNKLPTLDVIKENASLIENHLKKHNTSSAFLLPLFKIEKPKHGVRILTDQYSPANILNE